MHGELEYASILVPPASGGIALRCGEKAHGPVIDQASMQVAWKIAPA